MTELSSRNACYRPHPKDGESNVLTRFCVSVHRWGTYPGQRENGSTYLGWASLPWPVDGTYLLIGDTYHGRRVPTLDRGYLPLTGGTYVGWGSTGVAMLDKMVPVLF